MATLKEFKEWLERFPEDTIVQVPIRGWENNGSVNFIDFQIPTEEYGNGFEFIDFRNNPYVTPDQPFFGKCFLELGESN